MLIIVQEFYQRVLDHLITGINFSSQPKKAGRLDIHVIDTSGADHSPESHVLSVDQVYRKRHACILVEHLNSIP